MSGETRRRGFLTRDTVPTGTSKTISLPDNAIWQADFFGAVLLLTQEKNWQQYGTLTPDEMAAAWLEIVLDWMEPD